MIRLRVYWEHDRVHRFVLTGHAGYANAGEDIVCAGVSALVYNAVNSCDRFLNVSLLTRDEDSLACEVPALSDAGVSETVQLLIQSMVFGIRQIAAQYTDHVSVMDINEPVINRTRV